MAKRGVKAARAGGSKRAGGRTAPARKPKFPVYEWDEAVAACGWDQNSQLMLLEEFVSECRLGDRLARWISERAAEELAAGDEDPGAADGEE